MYERTMSMTLLAAWRNFIIILNDMKRDRLILMFLLLFFCLKTSAQLLEKVVINESLKGKFDNINDYLIENKLSGKIPKKYNISYVYIEAAVNNNEFINFALQDFYVEKKESDIRYLYLDNTYFIFTKYSRDFFKKYFDFSLIENNKLIKPTSFVIKDKYGMEETRGQLSFKNCNDNFYLLDIYLPFSETYLKKEFNVKYPDKLK